MRFHIRHETRYSYSAPVKLGAHAFRLRPREDGVQRLIRFGLEIEPAPGLRSICLDAEGNVVERAWFVGTTGSLRIVSEFEVETLRANPFDYVPAFGFDGLPASYPPALAALLAPYRRQDGIEESVVAFANSVAGGTSGAPIGFLDALNRAINTRIEREIRDDDRTQPPGVTLGDRMGACRDLTVLFMAACRAMGLAARFVSGYRKGDLAQPDRHLHSWPEVYIPGGGWRGWDPSEGIAVADTHVALVAAASQAETMPIEGTFIGGNITSMLDYALEIRCN